MDDWLTAPEPTQEQRDKGLEISRLYFAAFCENAAGAEILKMWEERIRLQRVPVNAPISEYAAIEAVRNFVYRIGYEIAMARTGGRP